MRRCASMEGNVLWASLQLGLMDDGCRRLRIGSGGCSGRMAVGIAMCAPRRTSHPSWRRCWVCGAWRRGCRRQATRPPRVTLERGVELLLEHHLLFHRSGALIVPNWGPRPDRIGFPIRFFDVLLVLELMADIGRLDDPRCNRALDLLLSKRTADGGFPMEVRRARTASEICSNCTFARWGPGGKSRTNPWVTIRALHVLEAAGRQQAM